MCPKTLGEPTCTKPIKIKVTGGRIRGQLEALDPSKDLNAAKKHYAESHPLEPQEADILITQSSPWNHVYFVIYWGK